MLLLFVMFLSARVFNLCIGQLSALNIEKRPGEFIQTRARKMVGTHKCHYSWWIIGKILEYSLVGGGQTRDQCLKTWWRKKKIRKSLNSYQVTIFLSEWEYCVDIEIPGRLSPAPNSKPLKDMSAVMLHFLNPFVNIAWLDQLTL